MCNWECSQYFTSSIYPAYNCGSHHSFFYQFIFLSKMRKIQNFSLDQSTCTTYSDMTSSAPLTPTQQLEQKKSIPKFNRKTSANLISRKPSQLSFQHQTPLCFISPKKTLTIQDNLFKSQHLQQASERFSSTVNEKSLKDIKGNLQSETTQSRCGKKMKKISKKDFELISDLVSDEKQKETLVYQILQLKKQNNNLSTKLKELEGIREFLMERQNHIYQISQTNMKQQEQIDQVKQINVDLTNKIQFFEKEMGAEREKALKIEQQYHLQLTAKKQEVQQLQKQILNLKEQVKILKQQNLKHNAFSKRSKQNSNSVHHKKHRNPLKSKSAAVWSQMIDITNTQLKSIDSTRPAQDDNKENQAFGVLNGLECISQLNDSDSFWAFKEQNCELQQGEIQNSQEKVIKKLKQKIRYCQIQIDVLNKIKMDSLKIKDENEKFKALNRKYLNRIQYFTKRYSRRGGSDSSLELSLTPKKRNDLN